MNSQQIKVLNNKFELLTNKAIFWHDQNKLIITDLHLAKAGHFRKTGIAVPYSIAEENIDRLNQTLVFCKTISSYSNNIEILILGDLFHSRYNAEVELFRKWRNQNADLKIHLIRGNHDIFKEDFYSKLTIQTSEILEIDDFVFTHKLEDAENNPKYLDKFIFSGHIHPGVKLIDKDKTSIKLPCFYLDSNKLILPAFGEFTGLYVLSKTNTATIFAIADNKIIKI